ncbi:hypothetical protein J4423_04325 [Candidatus Pacearchaeota archaeon]|nr:hypothetical protein [Candidatus Pacearchaeota archaeon]
MKSGKKDGGVKEQLESYISKQKGKWIVLLEIPEEKYFEINVNTLKTLIGRGFSGLHISLNRPYQNLIELLKEQHIDVGKLSFIDGASSQADLKEKETEKCIYISKELKIDELIRAIYKSIPKIKNKNKFLFMDSITTLALYQPLSETLRFAEFLKRVLQNDEIEGVVVNVAKDLAQKSFIKDIILKVDKVIEIDGGK